MPGRRVRASFRSWRTRGPARRFAEPVWRRSTGDALDDDRHSGRRGCRLDRPPLTGVHCGRANAARVGSAPIVTHATRQPASTARFTPLTAAVSVANTWHQTGDFISRISARLAVAPAAITVALAAAAPRSNNASAPGSERTRRNRPNDDRAVVGVTEQCESEIETARWNHHARLSVSRSNADRSPPAILANAAASSARFACASNSSTLTSSVRGTSAPRPARPAETLPRCARAPPRLGLVLPANGPTSGFPWVLANVPSSAAPPCDRRKLAARLETGEIRAIAPRQRTAQSDAGLDGGVVDDVDRPLVVRRSLRVAGEVAESVLAAKTALTPGTLAMASAFLRPSSVSIIRMRTMLSLAVSRYPPGTLPHMSAPNACPPPRFRARAGKIGPVPRLHGL